MNEHVSVRASDVVKDTGEEWWRIDLQWFAAEDEGRTEEPTEHKIRKAREEGKVARSSEVPSALVLLAGIVTLGIMGSYLLRTSAVMVRNFVASATEVDVTTDRGLLRLSLGYLIRLTVPVAIVGFLAALVGNIAQVGLVFSAKPITLDLSRILPRFGRFFKRAMFSTEAIFNLAKSGVKVLVIGVIAYANIQSQLGGIATMVSAPFLGAFNLISMVAFRITVEAALAMLLLALPDYLFQRHQHRESLKMSRQEVKEERRMYEGDPLVRSRMRERLRDILRRNMLKAVPKADVVITNPTHYAVALEWERLSMSAPTVVAKGVDHMAQRIREVATENGIPVVENRPLARTLHEEVEIGDSIPEKFYEVLATILAEVYAMAGVNSR